MWNVFGNNPGKAKGWDSVSYPGFEEGERSTLRTVCPTTAAGLELQLQHARLRKKFEDLKKRHGQDRQEWMREKELLLRQVADIQGGENRRILLDLKAVVEDVQLEVRREEEKRGELQLQYAKDRCTWEVERAELQQRIVQLESRGERESEKATGQEAPRQEREEQKRLLADTHTAAMAMRCQLEQSEQGWARHRTELLERFDTERREWESQLREMQRKVEELYNEVKARREGTDIDPGSGGHDGGLRLSLQSTSVGSSILNGNSNGDSDFSELRSNNCSELPDHHSNGYHKPLGYSSDERDSYAEELEEILQECLRKGFEYIPSPGQLATSPSVSAAKCNYSSSKHQALQSPYSPMHQDLNGSSPTTFKTSNIDTHQAYDSLLYIPQSSGMDSENERRKNATTLNAALKEIAKVSEELCNYQDEIKKKTEKSFSFQDEFVKEQNWKNHEQIIDSSPVSDSWYHTNCVSQEVTTNDSVTNKEAPPIPPRSTSWYLNNFTVLEPELHFPECKTCFGVRSERKCNSPSVLRKFGAMLKENEGKTLLESGVFTNIAPTNSNCNIGCCHSQWSSDGSKFGSSKSSTYVPVQKCLTEVAADCQTSESSKSTKELPMEKDFLQDDLQVQRNGILEFKTAEFNRTLFQVGTGYGLEEDDPIAVQASEHSDTWNMSADDRVQFNGRPGNETHRSSTHFPEIKTEDLNLKQPPQKYELKSRPLSSRDTSEYPDVKSRYSASIDPLQFSEVKPRHESTKDAQQYYEAKPWHSSANDPSQHLDVKKRDLTCKDHSAYPEVKANDLIPKGPPQSTRDQSYGQNVKPKSNSPGLLQNREDPTVATFSQFTVGVGQQVKAQGTRSGAKSVLENAGIPVREPVETWSRILSEQPWSPGTLAAYPRPPDCRSNYRAVEWILKSYQESGQSEQHKDSKPCPQQEEDIVKLLDILERETGTSEKMFGTSVQTSDVSSCSASTLQESMDSSSLWSRKSFSRPARPANQRPPSRWASRSPSAYSSFSSSQKQTFSYSSPLETAIL